MIDRRTFIGGCVAAGVGAALPKASHVSGAVDPPLTIPAGGLIYLDGRDNKTYARFDRGGKSMCVEVQIGRDRHGMITVYNTGQPVE